VTINGRPIPYGSDAYPAGTGELKYALPLEPGENVLVIQARDRADNLLLIERVVTFDTTPPWIQVISPTEGALLAKPEVTIIGTVEPTATLLIADEDVTIQNGYFERTILCLEGRNDILLNATDLAGNSYVETIVVFVDTEDPVIKITAPLANTVIVKERRYYINGTCAVKMTDGTTKVTASRILLNGLPYTLIDDGTGQLMRQPITIAENGTFSLPVDLLEGKNDYTVEVQDAVGNGATASRAIRLDTHAPTLVVYIDPLVRKENKLTSPASTVNITGYTDPGSVLTVKGILLPVADDGTFVMPFVLNPKDMVTEIVIDSLDPAGNVREIRQNITYMPVKTGEKKETNWGLWFLVISLIILVVVGIVSAYVVRSRRDEWLEMEAARTTPVAPIEPLEPVKDAETLPGPDEIGLKEEGKGGRPPEGPAAASTTAARPRPRPPQARRVPPARPAPKAPGAPEGDAKDLSDQGAEAESKAEETDQEGM
jgi:Glucodextranase, domain B